MHPKAADGIANTVDPDQTAPSEADPFIHCLPIKTELSVQKLRIITTVSLISVRSVQKCGRVG